MKPADVIPYIGLPWKSGATGPDEYDCWGLLRHIQLQYFGIVLPLIVVGDESGCRDMFDEKINNREWVPVVTPRHGDGVLLRGGDLPHVGVYLDLDGGGILHALEGVGVVFTHARSLPAMGFGRTTYYRFEK
ncbi:peptidoglycan endopeptidase [Xanthomonas citri pv. citri]|nr:hypothetical protein ART_00061 [Achromobacter phage vB_Ade_ART]MBD4208184.1 peptidoglycan endopeptidase [Xanthomonas citri pv. citri]